jgi:RNA polymerase sigma-54 factor
MILKTIQTFYPPGVAARDIRECLMLQLEHAGREKTLEYRILRDFFEALKKRKMSEMARGLGVTVDQIQAAVERIAHLEPRPGREFLP